MIGQQFTEVVDWMAHDTPQHVIKIFPGIDFTCLAGLDNPKEQCRGPGASLTTCKQPILATKGQRTNGVFRCVIIGFQPSIFEVAIKRLALIQGIVNGFAQGLRGKDGKVEFFKPFEDAVQNRPAALIPNIAPLLRGHLLALSFYILKLGEPRQNLRCFLGT